MKSVAALCLLTCTLFLTACSTVVPKECSWAEPIRFQQTTKDWLGSLEWPQSAYADFNKIGDHNELHQRFCN